MPKLNPNWPVLTTYDQDHLLRVALPLGGIGTGTVSLGGRGDLRDWEIMNKPAKGYTPSLNFFSLAARTRGRTVVKCLEGLVPPADYEGPSGARAANHGLPRFRRASFAAAYPLGQVLLSDPDMPLEVRIEAFNPMVPADADASGIPVAVLRFVLTNRTAEAVDATICGCMINFIGADGSNQAPGWAGTKVMLAASKANRNAARRAGGLAGVFMDSAGVDPKAEQFGTMALATTARTGVSIAENLAEGYRGLWEDLARGRLTPAPSAGDSPAGAVAVTLKVPPRATREVTYLIAWRFPNRFGWGIGGYDGGHVGNFYATQYKDAWDAAARTAARLADLERRTVAWVKAFCDSPAPAVVKEAALYNTSTLRTQTTLRVADGRLFGFEGCNDSCGCCHGSCTHVWNYEQATGFLFGELSATMREVEFLQMTREDGFMNFRSRLPLDWPVEWGVAAADGQMGALMRLYRDWQLSGDDAMLRRLWPKARKALEFAWLEKGWDPNRDGVMEGAQHHTLDMEYFGPNPLTGVWYLGALRACQEMAAHLGEADFAAACGDLFARGSRWMDENLFNGEYYEHKIIPPGTLDSTLNGLIWNRGRTDLASPEMQLGKGCLCDQLVGQYMAHVCGLGYLLKPANVRAAYRALMRYNFFENFYNHLNISRSFSLNDDRGLLMCTYPRGGRPKHHTGCYTETMTGFEYSAAVGMLQEGQAAAGLRCIQAIRDRYDGATRSPFNEAECGHHYARAMAAWGAYTTMTGFLYSGVTGAMRLAATKTASTTFWSTGYAWGTLRQKPARGGRARGGKAGGGTQIELTCVEGAVKLSSLELTGRGKVELPKAVTLRAGQTMRKAVVG